MNKITFIALSAALVMLTSCGNAQTTDTSVQNSGAVTTSVSTSAATEPASETTTTSETTAAAETIAETTTISETTTAAETASAQTETSASATQNPIQSDLEPDNSDDSQIIGAGDSEAGNYVDPDSIVMKYAGTYSNGRAMMYIMPNATGASVTIKWAGSATISSTWEMDGSCTEEGDHLIISYGDCVKTTTEYESEETIADQTVEYTDGTGTITVYTDGSVDWVDDVEDAANGYKFFIM